ncbi:MAG: segregation/condensation protein A [Deltaproteobacteria bacterium]|nr:segregation/condensation protein A [Deltaproteobacteria bacterium]
MDKDLARDLDSLLDKDLVKDLANDLDGILDKDLVKDLDKVLDKDLDKDLESNKKDKKDISVDLGFYEGPLGLLLWLIKINRLNIFDIPISLITSQYMEIIEQMEPINIELSGDFIVMASTLSQIKSKLLLPITERENEDGSLDDPRLELVKPLLEYASFQQAAENLASQPMLDRDVFVRGGEGFASLDLPEGQELPPVEQQVAKTSTFELVKAWHYLLTLKDKEEPVLNFFLETVTISQKIEQIKTFLSLNPTIHFQDLFPQKTDGFDLALTFLATLELARTGFLRFYQEEEPDPLGPMIFLAAPMGG